MSDEKKMEMWQKVAIGALMGLLGFSGGQFTPQGNNSVDGSVDLNLAVVEIQAQTVDLKLAVVEIQAQSKINTEMLKEIRASLKDTPTRREFDDIKLRIEKLESK